MAEIDPQGEVYLGRDNTGSAAYFGPRSKRTAIDEYIYESDKKAAQKKATKDALKAALDPGNLKAWERDTPYFQNLRNQYTQMATDYYQNEGKNPQSDAAKIQNILQFKDLMNTHAANSWADSERTKQIEENFANDKYAPGEEKKYQAWLNQPTEQRLGTSPELKANPKDWASEFMKTPALGSMTTSSESPSKTNPGFTNVFTAENGNINPQTKEWEWKPEVQQAALSKAENWLSTMGHDQVDAMDDSKNHIMQDPHLAQQFSALDKTGQAKMVHDFTTQRLAELDLSRLPKKNQQQLQPIPQPRLDPTQKEAQNVDMTPNYPVDARTQVMKKVTDAAGKTSWVASKKGEGEVAAINMTASRAYNFPTEVPLKTVPGTVINMNTGKEESVSGGRDYRVQGVFELPYVKQKDGTKILVSKETEGQYPGVIKRGWFAVGLQDAGTAKGEKVWEPRAIPFTKSMKTQMESLPKGKTTLNGFDETDLETTSPGAASVQPAHSEVPVVNDAAAYDALPKGTHYKDAKGKSYIKK